MVTKVRPDSKGRVYLGEEARHVSSYQKTIDKSGVIHLTPMQEVPAREAWLYENKAALEMVKKGLLQAAQGKVKKLRSFAKYADSEID